MKKVIKVIVIGLAILLSNASISDDRLKKEKAMTASGSFEVKIEPQIDENYPVGRMTISKEYSGGMVGKGIGQMISKRIDGGAAVYSAIEEFTGTVEGKTGSFTLHHNGYMSSTSQSLAITIVEGSGTGELKDIQGSLAIIQENGSHQYVLEYQQ